MNITRKERGFFSLAGVIWVLATLYFYVLGPEDGVLIKVLAVLSVAFLSVAIFARRRE